MTILVAGESLVDVVRRPGEPEIVLPGGSPANVAVALARLGRRVRLLTAYGDDRYGDLIEAHLREAGVEFAADPRILAKTSVATATLAGSGAASYEFEIAGELPEPESGLDPIHLHVGSIGALFEPGASVIAQLIERLRPEATISYGLNARPSAVPFDPARVAALAADADLVTASDEDLLVWRPTASVEEATAELLALDPAAVVVTLGEAGARCSTARGSVDVTAERVEVADTIGAGDSFGAAMLDELARRGLLGSAGRADLEALPLEDWTHVVRRANGAAAITVSRPGADPPTAAELD